MTFGSIHNHETTKGLNQVLWPSLMSSSPMASYGVLIGIAGDNDLLKKDAKLPPHALEPTPVGLFRLRKSSDVTPEPHPASPAD